MKKLIALLVLLVSFQLKAQEIYNSYNISGSDESNGGTYTYEAKVSCKSYLAGIGDIRYQLSITNYKITSFSYNGINAGNLDELNFPISKPNIQADVYFNLSYKEGSRYFDTNESSMLAVGQGYGDYADLSSTDVKKMVDYFGLKSNQDFQKLSIILSNIQIKKSYFEELSEAQNLIKQKLQTDNKIEQLKSQINSLGNSKEDLLKKKSLYQKLNSLDKENSYDSDISNIENDLKQVARNELDKEENEEETNTKNNDSNKDKSEEKQKEDEDYEKIKQQEKENREAARVTQQNWQYYENYKAKLERLRQNGQTNTEEYREIIKALKITESALPINHYDKYSTKIAFQEGATKAVNTFKSAVEDGTLTGLSLGISSRQMTDDEKYIRSLSYFNYNLGFHLFGKGKLVFGLGFPDSTDNGTGFSGSIAYDINLFGLKLMEDDNFDFIKFGLIVEGGGGTYNEGEYENEIDETSYFVGGGLRVTLVKFLYGTFTYGYATGEELGNEDSKTDGMYSQIGFGLSINF